MNLNLFIKLINIYQFFSKQNDNYKIGVQNSKQPMFGIY